MGEGVEPASFPSKYRQDTARSLMPPHMSTWEMAVRSWVVIHTCCSCCLYFHRNKRGNGSRQCCREGVEKGRHTMAQAYTREGKIVVRHI